MAEETKNAFCSFCGAKLPGNVKFCPECGKPVPAAIRNTVTVPAKPVPAPVKKAAAPVQRPAQPAQNSVQMVQRPAQPVQNPVQAVPNPVQPVPAQMPKQEQPESSEQTSEKPVKLSKAAALALPGGIFFGIAAVLLLARFAGGLRPVLDTLGIGTGSFTEYLEKDLVLIGTAALGVVMIGLIVLANRKRLTGSLMPIGMTFLIAGIIVCALMLTPLPAKRTYLAASALLFAGAAVLIAASFLDRKRVRESSRNGE